MAAGHGLRKPAPGRRLGVVAVAIAVPALVAVFAQGALAQTTRAAQRTHAPARRAGHKTAAYAGTASTVAAGTLTATAAAGPAPSASSGDGGTGVVEAKRLDGGTQIFKFSELDIEGRLKSPQLVYFLRRVRAEFSAGDLGHRTFMREMSETRKESTF